MLTASPHNITSSGLKNGRLKKLLNKTLNMNLSFACISVNKLVSSYTPHDKSKTITTELRSSTPDQD
jgi:hypothetical protein